jgi:hypothetical protein
LEENDVAETTPKPENDNNSKIAESNSESPSLVSSKVVKLDNLTVELKTALCEIRNYGDWGEAKLSTHLCFHANAQQGILIDRIVLVVIVFMLLLPLLIVLILFDCIIPRIFICLFVCFFICFFFTPVGIYGWVFSSKMIKMGSILSRDSFFGTQDLVRTLFDVLESRV